MIARPDPNSSFQYTGRENDGAGLYYYRARYYNQILNRFLTEDPLNGAELRLLKQNLTIKQFLGGWTDALYQSYFRYPGHLNGYTYVLQDPLKYTDPFGLQPQLGKAVGSIVLGSALVGAGVAHGYAATELGAYLGSISAVTPEVLALAEPIHVLGAVVATTAVGVALAGTGGYLIGEGINYFVPYLGEGRLGENLFDYLHPGWTFGRK